MLYFLEIPLQALYYNVKVSKFEFECFNLQIGKYDKNFVKLIFIYYYYSLCTQLYKIIIIRYNIIINSSLNVQN